MKSNHWGRLGPRSRFVPKARGMRVKDVRQFQDEYGALVYARLHNQRRLLQRKPTFDRVTIWGAGGAVRDADLFRDYKPTNGGRKMTYALITSRQWPETRFEYATRTLDEISALAMHDKRLKASGVKDYVIVTEQDKKGLAKFQAPELEHLFRSLTHEEPPEKVAYNELINLCATAIGRASIENVPSTLVETYRKTQRPDGSVPYETVQQQDGKKKPSPGATVAEALRNNPLPVTDDGHQPIRGGKKRNAGHAAKESKKKVAARAAADALKSVAPVLKSDAKKPALKAPKEKPVAPSSKGAAPKAVAPPRSGKRAANGAAAPSVKDGGLGRPGTSFRFMADLIMAGKGNAEISKLAKKEFPKMQSTEPKHVAWARWKLGQNGVKVPSAN